MFKPQITNSLEIVTAKQLAQKEDIMGKEIGVANTNNSFILRVVDAKVVGDKVSIRSDKGIHEFDKNQNFVSEV